MLKIKEYLGKEITVKIDRELGSKHPKHGFIYTLNYGYIPNTISGDGEELDAYIVGIFQSTIEFTGECIAIIHRINDDDDKLVVAPKGINYTDDQIIALTEFQEKWFKSIIIRK
ncbi:MAG: inorganic diphosphatase [Bacilli bacterium]|nr:inorganic diphosphatase [Bacilli bacterium]